MSLPHSIHELHNSLRKKEYSLVEMLDKYFMTIKANESLNAFITVTEDYAYEKARFLQKLLDRGQEVFAQYPLFGVAVAVKDLYLTKGIRTTAASRVLENYIPVYSSTAFEKLEEAGAILVGKTNCDAWAHGASGENSDFGPTRNPHNKDYVPGGSSSGSAVSVAANMSLIAMGTDTGGSIRLPASFCGVVGLKPTYGAVSRYGVVAMASSLDSMGHFTNTATDSQKVFEITRGCDGRDSTVKDFKNKLSKNKKKFKIGLPKEYFGEGLHPEVKEKVKSAARRFNDLGHEVIEVSLPHTEYAVAVYYIVQTAEVSSNLGRYDGVRYGNGRENFGSEAKRRIMLGTYVLSSGYYDAYYLKAMKVRTLISSDFDKVFESVDVILAPVSPDPPFKIGEKVNNPLKMYLSDIYTVSANLAGIPGLSIPVGFSSSGLPIGAQILGPRFGEEKLFVLAKQYLQE